MQTRDIVSGITIAVFVFGLGVTWANLNNRLDNLLDPETGARDLLALEKRVDQLDASGGVDDIGRQNAIEAIARAERSATNAVAEEGATAIAKLSEVRDTALAEIDYALSLGGRIEVGNFCFEPKVMIRCYEGQIRDDADHITWVGAAAEQECLNQNPPRNIERRIMILAECGKEN